VNVLDKHPWPWRYDDEHQHLFDANDIVISNGVHPPVAPLLLAAPELLAMLKELLDHPDLDASKYCEICEVSRSQFLRARALIARMEGKNP
jgi:hypothetical protein